MDTGILEDIGLTNAEIKVYLALLELGNSSAGKILDKTGLHNSVVHMALNSLIEKGLVSFTREGKHNTYQSSNPKHISEYIEEKKERFEKILPELISKQKKQSEKPTITTFSGIKGIRELLYELLEAGGKEHHTLGAPLQSLMMGEAWWEQYHKKRAAKGIHAKIIFYSSLKKWRAEKRYPARKTELRYTETGFEPLTETIIRNDKVGIMLWTEKPIGILVHNKELADSYETYFQYLWKNARPQRLRSN